MNNRIYFLFKTIFLSLIFSSCIDDRHDLIYLYPRDKSQVITVMTNYSSKERIISVGKLKSFEFFSENFVILDISGIYLDADEIGVCWNKNGHKWELVNDGAIIKENKLDATRYIFRNHWFEDEKGIPNIGYYIENQCGTVGTVEGVIYQNDSDIIIEYD